MSQDIAGYTVYFRQQLGRGGFGTVYKARNKEGILVAAKQVDTIRSERSAIRELESAQKHAKLRHENIVKILHIYNKEDMWVFMEFLDGGDLNNYSINQFAELKRRKIDIMTQTARGLNFLHELQIAHRDVKPQNILIQHKTSKIPFGVKLTDFGLSKFHGPEDTTSAMHTLLGTQTYMAPEFWIRNPGEKATYRKSVDIFALGLTYLALIQAKQGKNLRPEAEICDESQWAYPIGFVMFTRKMNPQMKLSDFVLFKEKVEDNKDIRKVKELIRGATSVKPEDRPTALQVLQIFENIEDDKRAIAAHADLQLPVARPKVKIVAADPSKVVCIEGDFERCVLGQEITSYIDTRQAGPGKLTVDCQGPHMAAHCRLFDHNDGTFTLKVEPQEAGIHLLQIRYRGQDVKGSPFKLKVGNPPDASKVCVLGPGIQDGVLATYEGKFVVETKGAGQGHLTVRVRGPKGAFRVELSRKSEKDRTVLCRYDPTLADQYVIHVKWSDVYVPGSPFHVNIFKTNKEFSRFKHDKVMPMGKESPTASKIRVIGQGVEHGILATFQSKFVVETGGAGKGQLSVKIRGPAGAFRVEKTRESEDRNVMYRYDPTVAGEYILHIKWSDEHVSGSPFHVHIFNTEQELLSFLLNKELLSSIEY